MVFFCHRFVDDRIHMHFHDNPTDTQHCTDLRSKPRQYYITEEPIKNCAEYVRLSGRFTSLHSVFLTDARLPFVPQVVKTFPAHSSSAVSFLPSNPFVHRFRQDFEL